MNLELTLDLKTSYIFKQEVTKTNPRLFYNLFIPSLDFKINWEVIGKL